MKTVLYALVVCSFTLQGQNKKQWIVNYTQDPFSPEAMLDLRYLNEAEAGDHGFIKLSINGRDFENGEGQPIRFWAVNGGESAKDMNDVDLARYARFLAKIGVNLIRYHGSVCTQTGNDINAVDRTEINNIWRVVAAMKKEGIYTSISPYWAGFVGNIPAAWSLGDYQGNVQPWALMYFNSAYKEAYKKWVEVLFTEINPYTGIALKDDPAVAMIHIKNEDSVLFWTIQGVKPSLLADIERAFYQWLLAKYTTVANINTAWSNTTMPTDNTANQRLGIYIIWEATQPQTGGKAERVKDQVQFLVEHQRNFYQDIVSHYKNTLGCKQLINGNNWRTASANFLNDAERYSNDVADVMAVNRYQDPQHIGENSNWRIDPGHQYVGKSVLFEPQKLAINIKQPAAKPFLVTESGWNLPHKYQAEGPFLIAAYMSLTGVDGFFWFVPTKPGLDPNPYFDFTNINGQKAMHRWTASVPGQVLMFPANALLYRKGYLIEGEPVVREERPLPDLWSRKLPIISEENGFDPNRDSWDNDETKEETELAPITYLTGPVQVVYGGNPTNNFVAPNLNTLLSLTEKKVTSNTNQLVWNYKEGICTMNAPAAQGVSGFLKIKSPYILSDVTITSTDDYATVNVVAMDDKPLKTSGNILIQVGTVYRPTFWNETATTVKIDGVDYPGFKIENTGVMPWRGLESGIRIKINNTTITSAWQLNVYGERLEEVFVERHDTEGYLNIRVPESTMYLVLNTDTPNIITGSIEQTQPRIQYYPNPVKDKLVVELPENGSDYRVLCLVDQLGRVLIKQKHPQGRNEIDLQNFSKGVYFLRASHNKGQTFVFQIQVE